MPGARRINNGVDALAMLYAMSSAILAMLGSGVGVVVDGQAFEPRVNQDSEDRLRELESGGLARVAIIEITAIDEQLADRQRRHAHPAGLSLHQNILPKQAATPDLVVDTTTMTAAEVAGLVCDWLHRTFSG